MGGVTDTHMVTYIDLISPMIFYIMVDTVASDWIEKVCNLKASGQGLKYAVE